MGEVVEKMGGGRTRVLMRVAVVSSSSTSSFDSVVNGDSYFVVGVVC